MNAVVRFSFSRARRLAAGRARRGALRALHAFLTLLLCLPRLASTQSTPSDSAVRTILTRRMESKANAGIVVAFMDHGTEHFLSYGTSNGPGTAALDENTVFEIGSVSKAFTGTVLADMVARGEVALEDPVSKYLPPSVHVPERNGRQITLLDLATQSSGLPSLPANMHPADVTNPYADYTVEQLYAFLTGYTLPRDPGAQYQYSNLGMGLLGHALALRAGQSYEALVTNRVLEPLGMRETAITLSPALRSRFATGHTATMQTQAPWDLPTLAGAGALRSTAKDMLTFVAANAHSDGTALAKTAPLAQQVRRPTGSPGLDIGLAWHILDRPSGRIVWHNGQTGGYHSFIGFIPATGANVVVLTNVATSIDDIGLHILDPAIPLQGERPVITRTEVMLDPSTLDRFVGEYVLAPTFSITVTKENGALWGQPTAQPKVQLFAEAPTEFFLKVVDAQISFVVDSAGVVTGMVLHQNGQNLPGRRVR
jgi:serine-type D-Ala-D-Ala carboxypeptidase/endopeptidase